MFTSNEVKDVHDFQVCNVEYDGAAVETYIKSMCFNASTNIHFFNSTDTMLPLEKCPQRRLKGHITQY